MASGDGHTLLSVRGEARRTVASDRASLFAAVTEVADSKPAAAALASGTLNEVLAELAGLGGQPLTVQSTRSPLTWSTHSIQTHEEFDHDKRTGEHGPTGRHRAMANLVISIRDFALLDAVGRLVTSRDDVDVHSVSWSVDDDNPEWAVVRAYAIHAALLKGQDYASALGGTVVRVEHVADAGLPGGDASVTVAPDRVARLARGSAESGTVSLDPAPQVLSAIIEARLTAVVGPLPER